MDLKQNLKLAKTRIPYFKVELKTTEIQELENNKETIIVMSLRHNYPVLAGIQYQKNKMATIAWKKLIKGEYHYLLRSV